MHKPYVLLENSLLLGKLDRMTHMKLEDINLLKKIVKLCNAVKPEKPV